MMEAGAQAPMQWGAAPSGGYLMPMPPPPGPPPGAPPTGSAAQTMVATPQHGDGQAAAPRPKKRRKTQLCPLFSVGSCKLDAFCPDAHGPAELVPDKDATAQQPAVAHSRPPVVPEPHAQMQVTGARPAFVLEEPAHIQASAPRPAALRIEEPVRGTQVAPLQAAAVALGAAPAPSVEALLAAPPAGMSMALALPEPAVCEERPEDMTPWDEKLEAAGATGIAPSWEALFATQEGDNPPPETANAATPAAAAALPTPPPPGLPSMVPSPLPIQPGAYPNQMAYGQDVPPSAIQAMLAPPVVQGGMPAPPPPQAPPAPPAAGNTTPSGRAILTPSGKRPLLTPSPGAAAGNPLDNFRALAATMYQQPPQ